MNIILTVLGQVLAAAGFDSTQLIGLGFHEGIVLVKNWIRTTWLQAVPAIAGEMADQGWKLTGTSAERPNPPADYVGRVQFKLWHRVIPGGWFRDFERDTHNAATTAAVAGQLDPADHAHNVRLILAVELAVAFGDPLPAVPLPAPMSSPPA